MQVIFSILVTDSCKYITAHINIYIHTYHVGVYAYVYSSATVPRLFNSCPINLTETEIGEHGRLNYVVHFIVPEKK